MKKQKIYYAIELTKPGAQTSRYALYEIKENKLQIVWHYPHDTKPLLPYQVISKNPKFPYCHFKMGNLVYNKISHLADELKAEIRTLTGWSPSTNKF